MRLRSTENRWAEHQSRSTPKTLKMYGLNHLETLPEIAALSAEEIFALKVVSHVLPFRTNNYVVEELIDWGNIPNDPMFQLTFMQKDMLTPKHFNQIADLLIKNAPQIDIQRAAKSIRAELNPHPAGQQTDNCPTLNGKEVPGVQHKYSQTVLLFPAQGQTCFAYCTFCFRWAQFVAIEDGKKFATDNNQTYLDYLKEHKEATDVLITGGDPLLMRAQALWKYIEPLLGPDFKHIQNIRIGTKALGFWPYRFLSDPDSSDLLHIFERIIQSGKHFAFMSHFNHPVELSTDAVKMAIERIQDTGAVIRSQAPVLRNVNDSATIWGQLWKKQVQLGIQPYYMFMERDTGPKQYFEIPIVKALDIYKKAYRNLSGLGRTARGPVMSAYPGKVMVDGVAEINGEKVFCLNFIEARNPDWAKRPFFAKYDEKAMWFDDLELIHPQGFID